ncbi:flagellar operon protein [Salibacterium salarium]|uniref:TIGR02530 family flagellar biosynthesis protein n=1 Tax=Salibacterium salarium TaxID=284579 RepID=UPI0027820528|nr:TIGR02530 family flagellar biosynthesis protein [Salibacterium salarium]MDQ0299137.1 flagellar operon protein [Salibacterium salarium]
MSSGIQTNSLHQLPHPGSPQVQSKPGASGTAASFKDVLSEKLHESAPLTLSKHAEKRLHDRDVSITDQEWEKIAEKAREAKTKGVNDALVLTDNAALVVSTQNDTVITAMNHDEAADHIFTNINGTIVVKE